MIKSPSFIHTHLSRTIHFNNQFGTRILQLHCAPRAILSGNFHNVRKDEPRDEHYCLHYDDHAFDLYCKLEIPFVPKMNELVRVVGICNGLVFLAVADDTLTLANTFMIFNPSMRNSVTLPKPTIGRYSTWIGFGFDAVTNDYKVVRFVSDRPNAFHEDYSLAGGLWSNPRSLDHVCEAMDPLKSQAFVNGAIHWGARRRLTNSYEYIILAFDLGSDSFHRIMVPKSFGNSWTAQLSVSGDGKSIALFQPYFISIGEPCLDIWVMKEHGMEELATGHYVLGRVVV